MEKYSVLREINRKEIFGEEISGVEKEARYQFCLVEYVVKRMF